MTDRSEFDDAVFSPHAAREMARRGLSREDVGAVLADPGRREPVRPGRVVLTWLRDVGPSGRSYVLRVFVDVDRAPPVVVTAYRSSKIGKYWSEP